MRRLAIVLIISISVVGYYYYDTRRRALPYYDEYQKTGTPLLFPQSQRLRQKLTGACSGHEAVSPYAILTTSHNERQDPLIAKLGVSVSHFNNADRLLITTHAASLSSSSTAWSQCLIAASTHLHHDIQPFAFLAELQPFYTVILYLNLTSVLPFQQFAYLFFEASSMITPEITIITTTPQPSITANTTAATGPSLLLDSFILMPASLTPSSALSCLWHCSSSMPICLFWRWL